jgi:hypothetical protein
VPPSPEISTTKVQVELELYLNQVFFIVGRKRGAEFDEGSVEDRASTEPRLFIWT